jgi:MFS family permease
MHHVSAALVPNSLALISGSFPEEARGRAIGTGPGINNAVARVAGLLAIAVFGVVLSAVFTTRSIAASTNWRRTSGTTLDVQRSRLAGAETDDQRARRAWRVLGPAENGSSSLNRCP